MTSSTTDKAAPRDRKNRSLFWRLTLSLGILICIPSVLPSATAGGFAGKASQKTEVAAGYRM